MGTNANSDWEDLAGPPEMVSQSEVLCVGVQIMADTQPNSYAAGYADGYADGCVDSKEEVVEKFKLLANGIAGERNMAIQRSDDATTKALNRAIARIDAAIAELKK